MKMVEWQGLEGEQSVKTARTLICDYKTTLTDFHVPITSGLLTREAYHSVIFPTYAVNNEAPSNPPPSSRRASLPYCKEVHKELHEAYNASLLDERLLEGVLPAAGVRSVGQAQGQDVKLVPARSGVVGCYIAVVVVHRMGLSIRLHGRSVGREAWDSLLDVMTVAIRMCGRHVLFVHD